MDAVRGFGGEVLLHGANFDEAKAKAIELSKSKHMTFIPPFDHPLVIAGQGTLAMEMLQQVADLDFMALCKSEAVVSAAGVAILLKQIYAFKIKSHWCRVQRFSLFECSLRKRWTYRFITC